MTTRRKPHPDAVYMLQQILKLRGGTIHGAFIDVGEDRFTPDVPVVVVKLPNGSEKLVIVQSDAEGNGMGWLDIIDGVKP